MYRTILFTCVLVACGNNKPEAKTASSPVPASTVTDAPSKPIATNNVTVSSEIARQCRISPNIDAAPKFGFDDSVLTSDDQGLLVLVARCMTDGPLKGRAIRLTGRADPRGEDEYNMSLGAHRADSARDFLQKNGVSPSRVNETSRGKLDATGTDEAGWARDRRVDISLI